MKKKRDEIVLTQIRITEHLIFLFWANVSQNIVQNVHIKDGGHLFYAMCYTPSPFCNSGALYVLVVKFFETSGSLKTIWELLVKEDKSKRHKLFYTKVWPRLFIYCENKNSVIFLGLLHQPRILLQQGWCAYLYQDIHQNWKLIW